MAINIRPINQGYELKLEALLLNLESLSLSPCGFELSWCDCFETICQAISGSRERWQALGKIILDTSMTNIGLLCSRLGCHACAYLEPSSKGLIKELASSGFYRYSYWAEIELLSLKLVGY